MTRPRVRPSVLRCPRSRSSSVSTSQSRPTRSVGMPANASSMSDAGCPAAESATRLPRRAIAAMASRNPRCRCAARSRQMRYDWSTTPITGSSNSTQRRVLACRVLERSEHARLPDTRRAVHHDDLPAEDRFERRGPAENRHRFERGSVVGEVDDPVLVRAGVDERVHPPLVHTEPGRRTAGPSGSPPTRPRRHPVRPRRQRAAPSAATAPHPTPRANPIAASRPSIPAVQLTHRARGRLMIF